jgi:hypothetical protein
MVLHGELLQVGPDELRGRGNDGVCIKQWAGNMGMWACGVEMWGARMWRCGQVGRWQ